MEAMFTALQTTMWPQQVAFRTIHTTDLTSLPSTTSFIDCGCCCMCERQEAKSHCRQMPPPCRGCLQLVPLGDCVHANHAEPEHLHSSLDIQLALDVHEISCDTQSTAQLLVPIQAQSRAPPHERVQEKDTDRFCVQVSWIEGSSLQEE